VSLLLPKRFRRPAAAGLMALAVLFLSGCSSDEEGQIKRLALPLPSSDEAGHVHTMWMWSWLTAMIVGVFVWGLIIYASIRFRRHSERDVPVQTRYNLPIEIFYTIAPIMIVIVFFYFTLDEQAKIQHDDTTPDETITVVGQQWSWTFNYGLGYDQKSEQYKQAGSEGIVHEGGTPAEQPTLWLPKDKSVRIFLHSPDVVHSFWVPAFLYKMDVVPGRHNHFAFTPTRAGTFEGRCAELCGVYHSRMRFNVKVVDQAAYDAHLKQLAAQGSTGPALGSAEVRTVPGLDDTTDNGGQ
jgi:cytochrome c oxidase subunit 2